ncbi:enoyl-CoA hydratase/isomerase family protein [Niabella beijingensis]|uniref:enoyl-CoA hydratase/isomerase family protein n=1 Tax=Niabella beijingensis TaxID=2872700 RepID=UPI001CBEA2D6|nr:enoyl-CoA hydratase-related protein [Niabella beijingensis]MBZ4189713.1 enoyl-CoA hydratase/isomerase family protein [Niabella beijingensis]
MSYQTILTSVSDAVLTITLNRPEKLNALNQTVLSELEQVVNDFIARPEWRSAIITGSGEKAFIAGADISEFSALDSTGGTVLAQKGQALFRRIETAPKPIIAAVNGFALGGGCELAMACHFRLASENARFGQPEVNLGLLPGYGGTQRLTQLVGKGRALELLLTGNMIDAVTAFNYGLVNHVVPQHELLTKASALLAVINTKAPLAVAACIEAANLAAAGDAGYKNEAESFGKLIASDDAREGIAAFMEKRKAAFKGR